ncbi:hypothetical protein BDY19DRAFT_916277 [Irpex rosettiformis]|uniref:Uncharacterized protein n=1 Tax=Irpex rosettiformis TaxID=378272 RepID=A0ACB8UL94_9APHY|nr:hypothetical protein BDY19DRAFT_916277 [Irpex rosettiformis]
MKTIPLVETAVEKKGHVCPPSDATHPKDRWETLFVYAFICKFTQIRSKVEGLDSPMDLEDAILVKEANPIMTQILARFIRNLRPQTRNLSSDVISTTVATVVQEFSRSNERSVFWNDDLKKNLDPFAGSDNDFWKMNWDTKLKILRQLTELQLCHSTEVKALIDRAWGVIRNKHKKTETTAPPPPPSDPYSQENLLFIPLGQDSQRKRYWVADDSPRVYVSTNPWKVTSTFQCVCSTQQEYITWLDGLKQTTPPETKAGERRTKPELSHIALVKAAEDRLSTIEAELVRIQRAKKKIAQRNLLIAQAEVRETRTRRRARPDYAYLNDPEIEDDHEDEYRDEGDDDYDEVMDEDEAGPSTRASHNARRRSARATVLNNNGNRSGPVDDWGDWRGERRSARLGAPAETQLDGPPPKRARTAESNASSLEGASAPQKSIKLKSNGAAAIKPTETLVESVAGKKKSRFWVYAVEPVAVPEATEDEPSSMNVDIIESTESKRFNGYRDKTAASSVTDDGGRASVEAETDGDAYAKSMEGSLSPASSMDES